MRPRHRRWGAGPAPSARRATRRRSGGHSAEQGFTLVELLVVVVILPLVVGAISVALLTVFKLQNNTSNRISASGDAQIVSANFVRDVQSAAWITTDTPLDHSPSLPTGSPTPLQCGTSGSQMLALGWGSNSNQTVVSYVELPEGTSNSLFRRVCTGGGSTPVTTTVVSHDAPTGQSAVVTCVAGCAASAGWIATAGVSGVHLTVTQPASNYTYSLTAVPRAWASGGGGLGVGPLELLGTGPCSTAVLSLSNAALVTVSGGAGTVGVVSTCPGSITLTGSSSLAAGVILTADSGGDSVNNTGSGSSPSTETYQSGGPSNPFTSLAPPPPAPGGTPTGTCTAGVCSPGVYATAQTFGSNVTFQSGSYWFEDGVTVQTGATATFGTGTYYFGTSSGFTGNALTIRNGGTRVIGTNGVLFYIATGSATFANGVTVNLTGANQYDGVTIWDDSATGATNPLTLANASAVGSLGGIYVPSGEVLFQGTGSIAANFVVAGTVSMPNSTTLVVG